MPSPNPHSHPPPKAIIFDLLTALLDSWTLWSHAAGDNPSLGRLWRTRYLQLTYSCGAYLPYSTLIARAATETPGLPPSAAATLLAAWGTLQPWPEVPAVLSDLRARGVRLAVLTNCSTELGRRAAARCCGGGGDDAVAFEFDAVLTAEEVGWYKPHPKAYEGVLEKMGLRAEEVLFVAGSSADVPGAVAAGMRVVWHNRVGLPAREGGVVPEREGRTLGECLEGVV